MYTWTHHSAATDPSWSPLQFLFQCSRIQEEAHIRLVQSNHRIYLHFLEFSMSLIWIPVQNLGLGTSQQNLDVLQCYYCYYYYYCCCCCCCCCWMMKERLLANFGELRENWQDWNRKLTDLLHPEPHCWRGCIRLVLHFCPVSLLSFAVKSCRSSWRSVRRGSSPGGRAPLPTKAEKTQPVIPHASLTPVRQVVAPELKNKKISPNQQINL